jgi:glyoxylase-like metal-dependent hydrolase (beta-lactamase superfamily II)
MRVHHLNCASHCATGRLLDGSSLFYPPPRRVCHCLLVEGPNALVLVDTGFGLADRRRSGNHATPKAADGRSPRAKAQTAVRQIEALGYDARDVRHIVLTHLDFDHAGGLDDFPAAAVHLLDAEEKTAVRRRTMLDRIRYRPEQWESRPRWVTYPWSEGEPWFGFECVRRLAGVPPGILLVPLPGHTVGHAGVAVEADGGWLLHAGDAYFHHDEIRPHRPHGTAGLRALERVMEKSRPALLHTQARLRDLVRDHSDQVTVFCSHDALGFEELSGRPVDVPAEVRPYVERAS